MALNIPDSPLPRLVIIGAGFAGLELAKRIGNQQYQVVLLDRNNFHQFQPLFYQVAMAGLEPSSIVFPIRKMFQKRDNIHIRPVAVQNIRFDDKRLETDQGEIYFDELVLATGAITNYYGNDNMEDLSMSLKSISEALYLRNEILSDLEKALMTQDYDERQGYIDIAIVGGGPTGVEIAGALAEMRRYIIPKDYVELDYKEIDIYLIQAGDRLLNGMSKQASDKAKSFLENLGVQVILNRRVVDYDGTWLTMDNDEKLEAKKLIWCAGVKADTPMGWPKEVFASGGRISVNRRCEVKGMKDVYAIGDVAYMEEEKYQRGHPQVAQVAIQQARFLAKYLKDKVGKAKTQFSYKDKGSMATIGRNRAVVDLPGFKFSGWFAWLTWLIVHLFALIGVKNKVFVFINWVWNYLTYDQSLRLIIRPYVKKERK